MVRESAGLVVHPDPSEVKTKTVGWAPVVTKE